MSNYEHALDDAEAFDRKQQAAQAEYADEEPCAAVIFCPLCCSNIDASDWGLREYECTNCATQFSVDLKPEAVRAHSMIG